MHRALFISDLHLCEERPGISALFAHFMNHIAPGADHLYVLGDLFEYWIGDDQLDHDALAREVAAHFARLADRGTRVFLMHGNRDFLLGARFAQQARLSILADPAFIDADGQRIALMHGDTLCTDDLPYQRFRAQVRDPIWQSALLARPYQERVALARSLRSQSDVEKSMKSEAIMDVNPAAVADAFHATHADVLIHGHTHRPACHRLEVDAHPRTRWVLRDWHDVGGYLEYRDGRFAETVFSLAAEAAR